MAEALGEEEDPLCRPVLWGIERGVGAEISEEALRLCFPLGEREERRAASLVGRAEETGLLIAQPEQKEPRHEGPLSPARPMVEQAREPLGGERAEGDKKERREAMEAKAQDFGGSGASEAAGTKEGSRSANAGAHAGDSLHMFFTLRFVQLEIQIHQAAHMPMPFDKTVEIHG